MLTDKKGAPQSEPGAFAKQESDFIAICQSTELQQAREGMLDLLCLFLKQDHTFNSLAYWEKRI